MSNLRLGIVGIGRHGSRYAKHASQDVDEIELVAVSRRDEIKGRAAANTYGCEYESDAEALITRDDIDAVVLVTAPYLLPRLVELALKHDKRLVVEKPVAPDLASGRAMLAMIEKAGAYCMSGHTLRFNSVCVAMQRAVENLGRIDSIVLSQRFPPQLQIGWLDDPDRSGGGNILHTGVHCFDLVRFLTGLEPRSASCMTRRVFTRRTEDNFVAVLGLDEAGALAMVNCSRSANCYNGLIEISGENGQLVGDHVLGSLHLLDGDGRHELKPEAPAFTVLEVLRRLVADAGESKKPSPDFRDGLTAVAVADACYRAATSGRRQEIAPL